MHKNVLDHEMDTVRSRSDAANATNLNHRSGVTPNGGFALSRSRPQPIVLPICTLEVATTAKGIGTVYGRTTNPASLVQRIRPASGVVDPYRVRDAACRLCPDRISSRTCCKSHPSDRHCGLKCSTLYRTDWRSLEAKLQCRYARCPVDRYRACPAAVLGRGNRHFDALWGQGSRRVRGAASILGIGRTRQTHATHCSPHKPGRFHFGRRHRLHRRARSRDAVPPRALPCRRSRPQRHRRYG